MPASSSAKAAARCASSVFLASSIGTAPAASSSRTAGTGAGGVSTSPPGACTGAGAAVVVVVVGVLVEPRSSSDMSRTPSCALVGRSMVLQVTGDDRQQFPEGAAA